MYQASIRSHVLGLCIMQIDHLYQVYGAIKVIDLFNFFYLFIERTDYVVT